MTPGHRHDNTTADDSQLAESPAVLLLRTADRFSSRVGHQSTGFKFSASCLVQFGPMAVFTPGRQSLCQSTIRQLLQRGINPPEAKCLLHDFYIGQRIGHWCLSPVAGHPTAFLRKMVLLKPVPELLSVSECQQMRYFHYRIYCHSGIRRKLRKRLQSISPHGRGPASNRRYRPPQTAQAATPHSSP